MLKRAANAGTTDQISRIFCCHSRGEKQASGFSRSIWVVMDDARQPELPAIFMINYTTFLRDSMRLYITHAWAFVSWYTYRLMLWCEYDSMTFWHGSLPVCIVTYDVGLWRKASLVLFVKKIFPHFFFPWPSPLLINLALRDLFGIIDNGRLTLWRVW